MEPIEGFHYNADLAIKTLSKTAGFELQYNEKSIKYLEHYVEGQRIRTDWEEGESSGLLGVLGSYLGESIIATYGGEWVLDDGMWGVKLQPSGVLVYPFNKIEKQWRSGADAGEGILGFFTTCEALRNYERSSTSRKHRWWQFWK